MQLEPPFDMLAAIVGDFAPGTVTLVGAGPGDSGLITVRGAIRLAQADVILHDKLIAPELLDLVRAEAEKIFVGKWRGQHVWTQDEINAALVQHARKNRRVVRLKGGDPFVFGRGGEECEYLAAAGIPYEVVPGITAAFGAPASAGIPLTHRDFSRSFVLVTGHAGPDDPQQLDFSALAKMETIAFYMGLKHLGYNCNKLIEAGMKADMPVAVIHWGTRPQQRTVIGTLENIADRVAEQKLPPPALVLIGQVVNLRSNIEWYERKPLHGQRIAVTRSPDQAASLSAPLIAAGAEIILAPTLSIAPIEDHQPLDSALAKITEYDWVVLTSANGVYALFSRMASLGHDARQLAGVKIAAIGTATAERLMRHGIRADLIPPEAIGESMADALVEQGMRGKKVLLLRGDLARPQLPAALKKAGAEVDDVPVYRTVCPAALPPTFVSHLADKTLNWVTFTSPSSFENLLTLLGEKTSLMRDVQIASIGPVTTQAIRAAGCEITAEAEPHNVEGLVAAIRTIVEQKIKTARAAGPK